MVSLHDGEELSALFRALADATRRDIVRRTMQGDVSISRLADDYAMSFAAVQKHVAVLEKAGLVVKTRSGRERLVAARPEPLARVRECLQGLEALWRHRLDQLDVLLSEPED